MVMGRLLAVFVCAALLGGCLPVTSKTPVGTTTGLGADAALYGTWKGHDDKAEEKGAVFVHFMKAKDGSIAAATISALGEPGDGWQIYRLRTATLGASHYINAQLTQDNSDTSLKNANFPLLYVLKGRTLSLYILDEDKVKAAIKAGKIKGTIEPGDSGDAVISEDAAALDAFFAKPQAAALFKPMLVLKRVE